jgi:enediyne biosynthesis protein E8
LPWDRPAFVGLPFIHRTALLKRMIAPGEVDRLSWVVLAFLAGLAFDTAAHEHTADAIRAGHPGLAWLSFPPPGPDGLWRFSGYSYRRVLADPHPATTPTGNPA